LRRDGECGFVSDTVKWHLGCLIIIGGVGSYSFVTLLMFLGELLWDDRVYHLMWVWFELVDLHLVVGESKFMIDKRVEDGVGSKRVKTLVFGRRLVLVSSLVVTWVGKSNLALQLLLLCWEIFNFREVNSHESWVVGECKNTEYLIKHGHFSSIGYLNEVSKNRIDFNGWILFFKLRLSGCICKDILTV